MPGRVKAKICGVTTPEAVRAALDGGADYLGFVFFPASPRALKMAEAARLAEPVRGRAKIVALTVDPTDALVDEIAEGLRPDLIQLHGKESPSRTREVGQRASAEVIKVLPVSESRDLDGAAQYEGAAHHLMFDAKPPKDSDRPGGHGAPFDWTLLAGRRFSRPWLLAGGLNPWNVTEAVRLSGAPIVDVSSGVERGPGLKDPALIAAFLNAVGKT